jgi:uncharacterized membrane protein YhaH (DUF805 family)
MNFDFKQFYLLAEGRVNRKQWWLRLILPIFVITLVLVLLDSAMGTYNERLGLGTLSGLFTLIALVPRFSSISSAFTTGTNPAGGC